MKKVISILLCAVMLFGMMPVFGVSASSSQTYCNVIFEEDFEGDTPNVTFTKISGSVDMVSAKGTVPSDADYGLGTGEAVFSNPKSVQTLLQFGDGKFSKGLNAGVAKAASCSNYSVEVSFDWNPIDYNAGAPISSIWLWGTNGSTSNNYILTMKYTGGDKDSSTHQIEFGNANGLYAETVNLNAEPWNITAADAKHAYRVRIVLTPYDTALSKDEKSWAGDMKVYIDGNPAYEQMYRNSSKENYIKGLLATTSNKDQNTSVDNIKVIEKYDELTSGTVYSTKDSLITAIRKAQRDSAYTAGQYDYITDTAKSVYEDEAATDADVTAAIASIASRKAEITASTKTLLHMESFEGSDYTGFVNSTDLTTAIGTISSVPDKNIYYGMGSKYYFAEKNDDVAVRTHLFSEYSESLQSGGTYKAEVAFDYIPGSNFEKIFMTCYGSGSVQTGNKIVALQFNENGDNTFDIIDREGTSIVSNISFVPGELMRVRLLFSAADRTVKINVNGTTVASGNYVNNSKEDQLAGISIPKANKDGGYIDNITLSEVTSSTEVDKDALLYTIRRAGAVLDGMAVGDDFKTAYNTATTVYNNVSATENDVSTAKTALDAETDEYTKKLTDVLAVKNFTWESAVNTSNSTDKKQDTVAKNLNLPTKYNNGTDVIDVIWESSNPNLIDATGKIYPASKNGYATLTAKFSRGDGTGLLDEAAFKTFKVRVLAEGIKTKIWETSKNRNEGGPIAVNILDGEKLLMGITARKGTYTFKLSEDDSGVAYTFTEDGNYDWLYENVNGKYKCSIYQNGVLQDTVQTETDVIKGEQQLLVYVKAGADVTYDTKTEANFVTLIGIQLDTNKAYVKAVTYTKDSYTLNVPVAGSKVTDITLKLREDVSDAKVYAAVYKSGALLAARSATVVGNEGAEVTADIADVDLPEDAELRIFLFSNGSLKPMMKKEVFSEEERTVIHMIGDSTMETNGAESETDRAGWGEVFGDYFNESEIIVKNYAVSGATTDTFVNDRFDVVKKNMKPGDYLFMQFGHNDQDVMDTTAFKTNLGVFIAAANAKGVTPVICSPIRRNTYTDEGVYDESNNTAVTVLTGFAEAAKAVAQDKGITYIGVNEFTQSVLKEITKTDAAKVYVDVAHTTLYGANIWANYVACEFAKTFDITTTATEKTAEAVAAEIESH